jgi:hypothetical protein
VGDGCIYLRPAQVPPEMPTLRTAFSPECRLRPPPTDTVRLGIRTVDYIAWLRHETVEAAKQRFAVLIEQSEAERLLNETGAPRPWQHAALAFGLIMRDGGHRGVVAPSRTSCNGRATYSAAEISPD